MLSIILIIKLLVRWVLCSAGISAARPKVFIIGFNKCGTKSLHHFFQSNFYLSAHSTTLTAKKLGGLPLAKVMQRNFENQKPLLTGLAQYDVFSDMVYLTDSEHIEANGFFKEFEAQYPSAYFILNDRPVEKWISSRLHHEGGPRGSFVARYANASNIAQSDAPARWRALYSSHKAQVLAYFAGNPRFLHFCIERHGPQELSNFLHRHYRLNVDLWMHRGSAAERQRKVRY